MKHANGAGSVTKLKDRKNKPWKAVITKGFVFDPSTGKAKQQRKVLGCYRTRTEAENALADYRRNPYDLDARKVTFETVYEKWSAIHFEKISDSKARGYKSAYNHAQPLHRLIFANIRPYHIEQCMADTDAGSATKNAIKQLCNQLYKYALKNEICSVNYAAMCDGVKPDAPIIQRAVFTPAEELLLWDNIDFPFVDMVLIGIYSGWRPQELAILKTEDIDLDQGIMYGGLKTKSGKNRAVPIHSKIYHLIAKNTQKQQELSKNNKKMLFSDENGKPMNYDKYYIRFEKICTHFGMKHTPHDTRHTFITKAKDAGMNEFILKLIVGHAITDLTEKVYTHRQVEELKSAMELIIPPLAVEHR